LCFEAVETASRLASERNPTEWETARLVFWRLYWGPLSMVEDQPVKDAMEKFGAQVSCIPIPESGSIPASALPRPELQQLSYTLAHAARDLVILSWRIRDLSRLQGVPTLQDTKFIALQDVKAEPAKASSSFSQSAAGSLVSNS
jgi:hypothetical protein